MAIAKRDENLVTSFLAVSDDDGVTPVDVGIDPVTNRLLIEITPVSDSSPATLPTVAPRDGNNVPVHLLVTDDASETITPFLIDSRNGLLYVDVLVE